MHLPRPATPAATLASRHRHAGSGFFEWGGACSGNGLCGVPINALYQTVTATFNTLPNARILGNPQHYGLLQSAYNDASTGAVIQAKGLLFNEELVLNKPRNISIVGGLDSDFAPQDSYTVLQGSLVISQGSVVVHRLIVRR